MCNSLHGPHVFWLSFSRSLLFSPSDFNLLLCCVALSLHHKRAAKQLTCSIKILFFNKNKWASNRVWTSPLFGSDPLAIPRPLASNRHSLVSRLSEEVLVEFAGYAALRFRTLAPGYRSHFLSTHLHHIIRPPPPLLCPAARRRASPSPPSPPDNGLRFELLSPGFSLLRFIASPSSPLSHLWCLSAQQHNTSSCST